MEKEKRKLQTIIRQALAGRNVNFKLENLELYPVAIIPGDYPYIFRDDDNTIYTISDTGLFEKDAEHGNPSDALTYEAEPFVWGYYDAITLIDDNGREVCGYVIGDKQNGPDRYKTRTMSYYTHIAIIQDTTGYVSCIELNDDGESSGSIITYLRIS